MLDKRLNHMCDPSLVDGVVSTELALPVPAKKGKAVKWEKDDQFVSNRLYKRLQYVTYFPRTLNS